MSKALKIYWTHWPNLLYTAIFLAGLASIVTTGALQAHWYMILVLFAMVPFVEYFTHKYLLHMPQPKDPEKHKLWARIANDIHYLHHQDPKKVRHIFAETWLVLLAGVIEALIVWAVTQSIPHMLVFMTAGMGYFMYYEWTHFVAHYDGYTPRNPYSRFLKKYHLWHHYKNEEYWYGVTNPLADWVFGKWKDPRTVTASGLALSNRRKRAAR